MFWIESKSTVVIALFVFSIAYVVAAIVFCLAATLSRRSVAKDLKAIVPVSLTTPLGVILGLLIAFLASRVWTNLDRAIEYVGQEASALRETVLLAAALPPEVGTAVREAVQRHLRLIEEEWPAMASEHPTLQTAVGLGEAMMEVLSFAPTQTNQRLAQERALVAIEDALKARRARIRLSEADIAPIQWIVIIVLAMLILVTIALIHIDNRLAMGISVFIFSTAIAACLVVLMVYDRPFGAGGFTVKPAILRAVITN
jgi:Protein of unknown function (DUF4239)